jgi:hypothetical protein
MSSGSNPGASIAKGGSFMEKCAYCNRPLICESCEAEYQPTSQEAYERLMEAEEAVVCPECEEILVCHWCKTPYDGSVQDEPPAEG